MSKLYSMRQHDLNRFHKKYRIAASGCWEWHGRLNQCGYGVFVVGHSRAYLAHRVVYAHLFGELKPKQCVLHKCDNRRCVNPAHLWVGTQADNVRDMIAKKRHKPRTPQHGEDNPMAKLTAAQVAEIRRRYRPRKITLAMLGEEFGVSQATISMIVNSKRWRRNGAEAGSKRCSPMKPGLKKWSEHDRRTTE